MVRKKERERDDKRVSQKGEITQHNRGIKHKQQGKKKNDQERTRIDYEGM